tara:strand:- start:16887 stop:17267 length:381 start_codon:yes stop_codon:yes gene_type:complete
MGILRKTKAVESLLKEFKKNSNAISAIELVKRLDNKFNKTTIYRLLDKLEDDGILHSFLGKNGLKWYAKCSECSKYGHTDIHPHFQCITCGKVDCLSMEISIPNISNREVASTQLLIQGRCELCLD